jgi:hypothetical protein
MTHQATGAAMRKATSTSRTKSFDNKCHNTGDVGAQHLADTDFAGTLFRGESRQAKQSQTGDKNGQAGEDAEDEGNMLFILVRIVEAVVQEAVG